MCEHKTLEECIRFHNSQDTLCHNTGEECPIIICTRKCHECEDTPEQKMKEAFKVRGNDHRVCSFDCRSCEYYKWCESDGWVNSGYGTKGETQEE